MSRGTWETRELVFFCGSRTAHSSEEAGNDRGSEGAECKRATVRGGKSRLDENPTTEQPEWQLTAPEIGPRSRDAGETLSTEAEAKLEGKAGTEVPVLYAVWPDLSARRIRSGMETGESQ